MRTCVIVGQNYPDRRCVEMVESHDVTYIFEPLPDAVQALRECFSHKKNVIVCQVACGEKSLYAAQRFNVCNRQGLSSSLGSVSEAAKQMYGNFDLSTTSTIHVTVVNLLQVLKDDSVHEIETLLIDAQGMDLTILKTLEPMIRESKICHIECEADGDGLKMYDGLPSNSVEDFQAFMEQYPQYKGGFVPNRFSFNPDMYWHLSH